jgi:hypothetical protein
MSEAEGMKLVSRAHWVYEFGRRFQALSVSRLRTPQQEERVVF